MGTMKVKLTFTEELLGTASADPEIHAEFIASKGPDAKTLAEEVADRIGIIHRGLMIACGTLSEVRRGGRSDARLEDAFLRLTSEEN